MDGCKPVEIEYYIESDMQTKTIANEYLDQHPECEWKPDGTSNVELVDLHERPVHVDRLQREDRRNPTWWAPHSPQQQLEHQGCQGILRTHRHFDLRSGKPDRECDVLLPQIVPVGSPKARFI